MAEFVQDHWMLNQRLTLDFGGRLLSQSIGRSAAFAPRAGLVYSPEEDAIAGQVVNVEYGGRDSLIDVKTPGGTLLHVRSVTQPALGDAVAVQVPVERALVYPAE